MHTRAHTVIDQGVFLDNIFFNYLIVRLFDDFFFTFSTATQQEPDTLPFYPLNA